MKKLLSVAVLSVLTYVNPAYAQSYSLNLSEPDKPASIEVSVANGSITVVGYEGKTIEITSDMETMKPLQDEHENDDVIVNVDTGLDDGKRKKRSMDGLRKVSNKSMQIDIEERNNKVEISSHTRSKEVNLTLKVPYNATLNLGVHKGGDIKVSDVSGPMELGNSRGAIYVENATGPIVAETHRQDIEVTFKSLDQSTPSSLTSHRGSIDITVPKTTKADVQVHTYKGEIYSGLDVDFVANNKIDHKKKGSRQEITIGGLMSAPINGGGQVLKLVTYRGDIYVRQK